MAAITPYLEQPEEAPEDVARPLADLASAYGAADELPRVILAQNSAVLHRFVWTRQLIEEYLRGRKWWMENTRDGIAFRIDQRLPEDLVPWRRMSPGAKGDTFMLWSEGNRKMACPSWDLPAGAPYTGGSCIGATAAQPVVPVDVRKKQLVAVPDVGYVLKAHAPGGETVALREAECVCLFCYASEGSYGYLEIQTAEILRQWWSVALTKTAAGRREWVEIMSEGLLSLPHKMSVGGIRPVRVHSSGDFMNFDYARAWMELANAVAKRDPSIKFWAPTRTWAAANPDWNKEWPRILGELKQPNFVVRASAYHTGDSAPEALVEPGTHGYARGTTAIFADDHHGANDDRREWDCPVYALHKQHMKGSCEIAKCRVCWIEPEKRVNYTVH